MPHHRYDPQLKRFARELRNNSTLGEVLLWQRLRGKKCGGYDFHRQKPMEHWIVDFFCPSLNLAIEIDGSTHDLKAENDDIRQQRLERLGIHFIRFPESYVRENPDGAVQAIEEWIQKNAPENPPRKSPL